MNLISLFKLVITTSIYASIVGIVILAIKMFAGHKISAKWNYLLWTVLLFKLLVPFGPESGISLFNVAKPPVMIYQTTSAIRNDIRYHTYSLQQSHVSNEVQTPASSKPRAADIAPLVWLVGCAFMLIWFGAANMLLRSKLKNSQPASERILSIFNSCKVKTAVKKDIELIVQGYIPSPSLFSIRKPKILIPNTIESLSDKGIEYIFLHELAHYKHRDIFVNYTLLMFQALHWFNPIIWYCFKKARRDMELAADEKALSYLDNAEYKDYGKALLTVIESFSSSRLIPGVLGMADENKHITQRVKRISKFKKPKVMGSIIAIVVVVVVGAVCLTGAKNVSIESPAADEKIHDKASILNNESGIIVKIEATDEDNHHHLLHGNDLLALINELNAGGASYIRINDIPVNASTALDDRLINMPSCTIKAWDENPWDINQSNDLYEFVIREHGFLHALKAYGFEITVEKFSEAKQPNAQDREISNTKGKPFIISISDGEQNRVYDTDILMLKNELYLHGAETITINDTAIAKDSYFSCSDYLTHNGQILYPPYTLKAYGNYTEISEKMHASESVKLLLSYDLSIKIDGCFVKAITGEQIKEALVPQKNLTPAEEHNNMAQQSLPSQNIKVENKETKKKIVFNSLLPGTNINNLQSYLSSQGKVMAGGGVCNLSGSYSLVDYHLQKESMFIKTVSPDSSGAITFFTTGETKDVIYLTVTDKQAGKSVLSGGFTPSNNSSYSFIGLNPRAEYDIYLNKQEHIDYRIIGKILIY